MVRDFCRSLLDSCHPGILTDLGGIRRVLTTEMVEGHGEWVPALFFFWNCRLCQVQSKHIEETMCVGNKHYF